MQPTNKPSWSILDRTHRWTPSNETNIRRLFSRIRYEQAKQKLEATKNVPLTMRVVK